MDVNADNTLVRVFDLVVAIVAKLHDGLLFIARAIRTMTLDAGRNAGKLAFYFDMSQDGWHVDTSGGVRARGVPW